LALFVLEQSPGQICHFHFESWSKPVKSIHVVPCSEGWSVEREGRGKGHGGVWHYPSHDEALAAGRKMAEEELAELVVHGRDGKIRDRSNFGSAPSPSHVQSAGR
jgi:hypothetical protein